MAAKISVPVLGAGPSEARRRSCTTVPAPHRVDWGMGADISLFSGYSQKENRTTNYCLLVLKLLYDENPKFLGEALSALVGEDMADIVGVTFRQQARMPSGVPDGVITQRAFTIHIETKNFDWFYDAQLERHLEGLATASGVEVLVALGNLEVREAGRFARVEQLCTEKYRGTIYFRAATFEDFVDALPTGVSKTLSDTIDDFEAYLDDAGLLPRWKYRLDVVNCSGRPDDVITHCVYICPAKTGAYQHSRAKYFGMYASKAVRRVALIEAVVEVDGAEANVRWKHVDTADADLVARAVERKSRLRAPGDAVRVFLLGPQHETLFEKRSRGGMQGSKMYFDVSPLDPVDAADLAVKLRDKSWADLRG